MTDVTFASLFFTGLAVALYVASRIATAIESLRVDDAGHPASDPSTETILVVNRKGCSLTYTKDGHDYVFAWDHCRADEMRQAITAMGEDPELTGFITADAVFCTLHVPTQHQEKGC